MFLCCRNTYLSERKDVHDKYRNAVKVVVMWLDSTETRLGQLPDIARSLTELRTQLDQLKVGQALYLHVTVQLQ